MSNFNPVNSQIKNRLSIGVILFLSIFLAMGLTSIFSGVSLILESLEYKDNGVVTLGQVTHLNSSAGDNGYSYSAVVSYQVDGKEYQFQLSSSSSPRTYNLGEIVEVIYLDNDHEKGKINDVKDFWGPSISMFFFGLIFFSIGFGGIYSLISRYLTRKKLISSGARILANFDGIDFENPDKGRSYWRIIANWHNPANGKLYIFESDRLYFNPERYFSSKQVPVLINQQNPLQYIVDLSSLPQEA